MKNVHTERNLPNTSGSTAPVVLFEKPYEMKNVHTERNLPNTSGSTAPMILVEKPYEVHHISTERNLPNTSGHTIGTCNKMVETEILDYSKLVNERPSVSIDADANYPGSISNKIPTLKSDIMKR
jgi:hypothetical protein